METEDGPAGLGCWDSADILSSESQLCSPQGKENALAAGLLPPGKPGLDSECVPSGPCRVAVPGTGHLLACTLLYRIATEASGAPGNSDPSPSLRSFGDSGHIEVTRYRRRDSWEPGFGVMETASY